MKRVSLLGAIALLTLIAYTQYPSQETTPESNALEAHDGECLASDHTHVPGTWRRYALEAHGESATSVLGQEQKFQGELNLNATLELLEMDARTVQAKLLNVDSFEVTLLGKQAAPDVTGTTAYITLTPNGAVDDIAWGKDTSEAGRAALGLAIRASQVITAPGTSTWTSEHQDTLGKASYAWTTTGCDANKLAIRATPQEYSKLDAAREGGAQASGHLSFTLDASGALQTLQGDISANAEMATSAWDITMSRIEQGHNNELLASAERSQRDSKPHNPSPADIQQQLLESRVDGMTWDDARADILAYANGGQMPDHKRWLWRTTGLLKLHPETAEKLAAMFEDERLGPEAKALVLDLLANVGHAQAQHQLRNILDTHSDSPEYTEHVQRLLLLPRGEEETAQLLSRHMNELETPDARYAAAVTLGAVTSKLEDPQAIQAMTQKLAMGLASEKEDPSPWLDALGNAGTPEVVDHVREHINSESPNARTAAARALRKVNTPEAREVLLGALTSNSDTDTRREALNSLSSHDMDVQDMTSLADWAQNQDLNARTLRKLLGVLQSQAKTHPDAVLDLAIAIEPKAPRGSLSAGYLALIKSLTVS